ncbi:CMRF35-like molecule 7 [Sylvia atricapilla]|uniref:CMRF35-like molecule 7 n=1 Tax=Sylvia atricapilla TaxID=48155 RepID=UPI003394A0C2
MRIFLVWTLFFMTATSTGGQAVTGPKLVRVEQGSSLAVSCSYRPRYKLNSKYWCLKSFLSFCLTYIIQTNGSEVTVTRDRMSIRDNHTANSFTVTLSSVTSGDAGHYSCGVKRKLRKNQWHSIKVMVSAAVSNTSEDSNVRPLSTNPLCPRGFGEPPVPSNTTSLLLHRSQLSVIHLLLLLLSIKVPVAVAVVCGAAWLRSRCRSREQEKPQLSEARSSPWARGCPPVPTIPEPQGRPPAPRPPPCWGRAAPHGRPVPGGARLRLLLPLESLGPPRQPVCWSGLWPLGRTQPASGELQLPAEDGFSIKAGCQPCPGGPRQPMLLHTPVWGHGATGAVQAPPWPE